MLQFFRVNDPARIIALIVVIVFIHLPALIDPMPITLPELRSLLIGERVLSGIWLYEGLWDSTAPLISWFYAACYYLFGDAITGFRIMGILLILIQAVYFSVILINSRAFNESTYVTGMVYISLFFFSPDTITLSPLLLSMPFLLRTLDNIFGLLAFRLQRDETYLNTGIYLSIASLIDFSHTIFLFFTIAVLVVFGRTSARKILLVVFGFGLPHVLMASIYFVPGKLDLLWNNFYLPNILPGLSIYIDKLSIFYLGLIPLVFLLFSTLWLSRGGRFTNYQSQLAQVMWLWLFFGIIQIWYGAEINPQAFVILVPPFAFLISHYFLLIRRRKIAGVVFTLFVTLLLAGNYLTRYNVFVPQSINSLFVNEGRHAKLVKQKRILVLSNDMQQYYGAYLGSSFLEWRLAKDVFNNPNSYDAIRLVEETLSRDLPEIIIDEQNLLALFFERIPQLQKRYQKRGDKYYLLNS